MQTIVLAATIRETYAWARAQGRGLRSVRHIPNASALAGRNYDKIVELPSFKKRRDRFAIQAGVRQLKRRLPLIPYEVDEDWVMPDPPKRVAPANLSPTLFLFANAPVEAPLADVWAAAVKLEAEEDYSIPDDGPKAELDSITEEVGKVSDDLVTLADGIQADTDADIAIPLENKGSGRDSETVPEATESVRPKRKGRRTNEQKAYDEALTDWENNGGSFEAVVEAREALAKRHPDDERLTAEIPGDPRNVDPDLDF